MRTSPWFLLLALAACSGDDDASDDDDASSSGGSSGSSGNPTGGSSSSSGNATSSGGSSGNTSSGNPGGSSGTAAADPNGLLPTDSIWQTTSEWYRDISQAPTAEHSDEMIGALPQWGDTGNFQIDFAFVLLDGTGAPTATFPQDDESDNVPVPIPANGYIEGPVGYEDCGEEDCHLLVLDRGAKKLYEVYGTHKDGADWEGAPSLWQLDKTYPRSNRGKGCTSADAAGLAITPGLIGYKETKAGHVGHALRLVLKNDYIRGSAGDNHQVPLVAYPASHGSLATKAPKGVPYGGRLRLKASVSNDDPRFTSPGAKALLKALHTYGMIVADGGKIPLMAENIQVHHDADASATWEGILDSHDLIGLLPSDFEVVGIPIDVPGGAPGYHSNRAEYEAELKTPLGCDGIVQP